MRAISTPIEVNDAGTFATLSYEQQGELRAYNLRLIREAPKPKSAPMAPRRSRKVTS